jgi:diguanylate cyclase (GGDEF)-like protein/PAS domain S-box-containing protein
VLHPKLALNKSLLQKDWGRASLLALTYFIFAQIGLSLSLLEHSVTVFWPSSGIGLAAILMYGYRIWPGVLIGSFIANLVSGLPLFSVLGMATGSTLETLLGAYLLNQHARFNVDLSEARDIFRLMWRGGILSTLISALIGVLSLTLAGAIEWSQFGHTMLIWWMGDTLGVVVVTPIVIALFRHPAFTWTEAYRKQAILMFGILGLMCLMIFTDISKILFDQQPRVFMLVPLVVWASLSFNSHVLSYVILTISFSALFSAANNVGFFHQDTLPNLLDLWGFLLIISIMGVSLAAVNYQRNRARINLERSEKILKRAQHVSRVGSWELNVVQNKIIWSEEAYAIFGLNKGTSLSIEQFFNLIHPGDVAKVKQAWQENMRGIAANIEHRILVNGKIKWVHEQSELDLDAKGKVIFAIGTITDISATKFAEISLRESQQSQQAILDAALDAVIQINESGRITGWNKQATQIFGWEAEQAHGQLLHDLIVPEHYREAHWKGLQRVLAGGETRFLNTRVEVQGLHRDGHIFTIELALTRIKINEKYEFSAFIRDVTQRKHEEEQLRLAAKVFDNTNESILITDINNNIVAANSAFTKMTGYTFEEIKGHNPRILASGEHDNNFYHDMWKSINTVGNWQGEIIDKNKAGKNFYKHLAITAVKNAEGIITHHISISSDISQRKEYDKNIHFLAYYDVLTGLPNRTLLRDRLGQLIASSHRDNEQFALLFLDLDRFKYINDSMGHSVGDKLLQSVAQRLQACVREGDTVSRIGGDEFIVLLRQIDEAGVQGVADKLLKTLATPFNLNDQIISTYASVGIALYPQHATDLDVLMKNADAAMYNAKENGRNNYKFFAPEMNFRANKIFSMEKDLRSALDQDHFTLVYQPQVDLASGKICGAEALIRWKHPDDGFISPAEFIPVAEETGQIVEIGEWVLKTACWRFAMWQKQGMPAFPIAINMSIRQLRQPNLADMIEQVLQETGLNPNLLELEITEGIMMGDNKSAMAFLMRMHALGVQMSIDDFGTGFSSLSYLKNLPVHKLKIDQSFVRDIETDESDAAIVRSIISLGHRLDLKVIAEGVETLEQLDFLRIRGCDEVQGYFYSKPLTPDEFIKFVNSDPQLP